MNELRGTVREERERLAAVVDGEAEAYEATYADWSSRSGNTAYPTLQARAADLRQAAALLREPEGRDGAGWIVSNLNAVVDAWEARSKTEGYTESAIYDCCAEDVNAVLDEYAHRFASPSPTDTREGE